MADSLWNRAKNFSATGFGKGMMLAAILLVAAWTIGGAAMGAGMADNLSISGFPVTTLEAGAAAGFSEGVKILGSALGLAAVAVGGMIGAANESYRNYNASRRSSGPSIFDRIAGLFPMRGHSQEQSTSRESSKNDIDTERRMEERRRERETEENRDREERYSGNETLSSVGSGSDTAFGREYARVQADKERSQRAQHASFDQPYYAQHQEAQTMDQGPVDATPAHARHRRDGEIALTSFMENKQERNADRESYTPRVVSDRDGINSGGIGQGGIGGGPGMIGGPDYDSPGRYGYKAQEDQNYYDHQRAQELQRRDPYDDYAAGHRAKPQGAPAPAEQNQLLAQNAPQQGERGPAGKPGETGRDGEAGKNGIDGKNGDAGRNGAQADAPRTQAAAQPNDSAPKEETSDVINRYIDANERRNNVTSSNAAPNTETSDKNMDVQQTQTGPTTTHYTINHNTPEAPQNGRTPVVHVTVVNHDTGQLSATAVARPGSEVTIPGDNGTFMVQQPITDTPPAKGYASIIASKTMTGNGFAARELQRAAERDNAEKRL